MKQTLSSWHSIVGTLYFVLKSEFAEKVKGVPPDEAVKEIITAICKSESRNHLQISSANESIGQFQLNFARYIKDLTNPMRIFYPLAAFLVWNSEARSSYTVRDFMSLISRRKKQTNTIIHLSWAKEVEVVFNAIPEYKHLQEQFLNDHPTENRDMLEKFIGGCLHEKELIKTSGGIERVNQGELFTPSHASGQWR
jgi:hypothetical protein